MVSGVEHKYQGKSVRVLAVDSYSVHFLCVGDCPKKSTNNTDGSDSGGSGSDGSGSGSGDGGDDDSEVGSDNLPGLSYIYNLSYII